MTSPAYPVKPNVGEFVERMTLDEFYTKYIKSPQEIPGIRAFMYWRQDSEIVDMHTAKEPYSFYVNSLEEYPSGRKQFSGELAASTVVSVYKSEPAQPAQPEPLPPARMAAAGRSDLVEAVRNLFSRSGSVDEYALFKFVLDVMGDQKTEPSRDPQPLIEALEAIASGATGDYTADYVAQQGLEAYKLEQKLTVGGR